MFYFLFFILFKKKNFYKYNLIVFIGHVWCVAWNAPKGHSGDRRSKNYSTKMRIMHAKEKEGTYKDIMRRLMNKSCMITLPKMSCFKDIIFIVDSVCIKVCFCVLSTTSQQRVHIFDNVQTLEVQLVLLFYKNASLHFVD